MADSGKQSPLGQNALGGLLQNRCIQINPNAEYYMGISKSNSDYTYGQLIEGTVLRMLTWSINDGFTRQGTTGLSDATYNNLISISGDGACYALGNAKPPTYVVADPSGVWTDKAKEAGALYDGGPANAGYSVAGTTDYGQSATWAPYNTTNINKSITQWGWIRCHALQAHNEFNYHATAGSEGANLDSTPYPKYEDFTASFATAEGWIGANNPVAIVAQNAPTFMEGAFTNMDDLITGDFAGVTKSLGIFGDNLKYLGKLIDLTNLDRFGFPSTLLQQLYTNGGLTQDLNLTLGAAGLSAKRIKLISKKETIATELEEKQLYSAYVMITGENLINCISPMTPFIDLLLEQNVSFPIRTLADCLDVKRLFNLQDVWSTLTVPLYNTTTDLPTGAKTYYLIYNTDGSVNGAINTDAVKKIVGTLIPSGSPATTTSTQEEIGVLPTGYDSYLGGPNKVLPTELGLAAAAFRYTMLQITSIEQLTPGTIGRCIGQLELNTDNGSGANGTEGSPEGLAKPVNTALQATVAEEMALGSGWAGTYTYSDFFGCMSGLPYAWDVIYGGINQTGATQVAQASTLAKIYQQLFLAVTWKGATISPVYTGTGPYTVTGWTITDAGGGYLRGTAPDPVVTFSDGLVGTCDIGRDDKFSGSNSAGTFGRVISIEGGTGTTTNIPTATIETPPTANYTAYATNGVNTTGGSFSDPAVQNLIDQANAEIINIVNPSVEYSGGVDELNMAWEVLGRQLAMEQRTRYIAFNPVEVPRDPFINSNQNLLTFVDTLPTYAQDTRPHMSAQTIEMIVDRDCNVGQNIVATMRSARNQAHLASCGIPLSDNIPDSMPIDVINVLKANNTVPGALTGIGPIAPFGQIMTNPAWPVINPPGSGSELGDGGIIPPGQIIDGIFFPMSCIEIGTYIQFLNGNPYPQVGAIINCGTLDGVPIPPPPPATVTIQSPDRPTFQPGTIPKSQPTVEEAIEQVILCNCDCWDLIT